MRVGQEVEVINSKTAEGLIGTIIAFNYKKKKHTVGVEFEEEVADGHDCDGAGTEGYCRWLKPSQLIVVNPSQQNVVGNCSKKAEGGKMLKKLTTFLKRTLGKSANQYRVGWLEVRRDELVPTTEGIDALNTYLMTEHTEISAAMNKLADDRAKELDKSKKDKEE